MATFGGPWSALGPLTLEDDSTVDHSLVWVDEEPTTDILGAGHSLAFRFDAVNAKYLNAGHEAEQLPASITVGLWVYLVAVPNYGKFLCKPLGAGWSFPTGFWEWMLGTNITPSNSFQWSFDTLNGIDLYSTTTPTAFTLYHVVGTYDHPTTTGTLYINGVSEDSAVSSQVLGATTEPLCIGGRSTTSPGEYCNALVQELACWGRALSAAEVLAWYNEQNPSGGGAKREISSSWMSMADNFLLIHGYQR